MTPGNSHYYYHFDGQGTVIALIDSIGQAAERYSPFGESSDSSPLGNPYRYTGRRLDNETGLYYYRARHYSAALGRFLQPDPLGYGDGMNLYAYVGNDPLNFVDPLGLYSTGTFSDRIDNAFALIPETAYDVYDQAGGNIGIALSGGAPGLGFSVKSAIRSAPALVKNLGATVKGLFTKGTAKSGDNFVDGYRAVSKAEADDIAKHGFRPDPSGRSMQDKWFSETREGAEKFRQNYSDLDGVFKAKVPKEVYDRSYKHPNIDNTGPGFCVACDDLSRLKVGQ